MKKKQQARIFAISDIHGNFDEFYKLLDLLYKKAVFNPSYEHLVLLGDLVDSGPKVKDLINWCIDCQKSFPDTFHVLKGNHESILLDALRYKNILYGDYYVWWDQGGRETIRSYQSKDANKYEKLDWQQAEELIGRKHLDWLDALPLYWETDNFFFVHGGVLPDIKLADHDFNDSHTQFEMIWIRDEFIDSKFNWEKKIIFGHSSRRDRFGMPQPIVMKNKIGINTQPRFGCGYITALELPKEKFWKL